MSHGVIVRIMSGDYKFIYIQHLQQDLYKAVTTGSQKFSKIVDCYYRFLM